MPLPHNLYDYCSIRISSLVEKYLVVKRKISFVDKADILLTKLIIREEYVDVAMCYALYTNILPGLNNIKASSKWERWAKRLGYEE